MNTEFCPSCYSANTYYADQDKDKDLECRMCGDCGETWWNNHGDPDDDFPSSEGEFIDSGLLRHIERNAMYGRLPNDQN